MDEWVDGWMGERILLLTTEAPRSGGALNMFHNFSVGHRHGTIFFPLAPVRARLRRGYGVAKGERVGAGALIISSTVFFDKPSVTEKINVRVGQRCPTAPPV
jgi:hypothetical protein